MEDSIFITVLEYGETVGLEGTNVEKFKEWVDKKGIIDNTSVGPERKLLINSFLNIFDECFQHAEVNYDDGTNRITKYSYVLKTEYYFRLIEYRELRESRTAARSANKNAMFAITIAILAIIASTVLTYAQLNTPASINKSDLQALINSNAVQKEIKLDSLQMAQILSAMGQSKPAVRKNSSIPSNEIKHHELINRYFEGE